MCDFSTINAEQLATVTDRLLHRGAAKRGAKFLRVPPRLDLDWTAPRITTVRPRWSGRDIIAVLATAVIAVIVLRSVVVAQRGGLRGDSAAPHGHLLTGGRDVR